MDGARRNKGSLKLVGNRYEIEMDLRIKIDGLRLTAELRPAGDAGAAAISDMNITSVFKPGTA